MLDKIQSRMPTVDYKTNQVRDSDRLAQLIKILIKIAQENLQIELQETLTQISTNDSKLIEVSRTVKRILAEKRIECLQVEQNLPKTTCERDLRVVKSLEAHSLLRSFGLSPRDRVRFLKQILSIQDEEQFEEELAKWLTAPQHEEKPISQQVVVSAPPPIRENTPLALAAAPFLPARSEISYPKPPLFSHEVRIKKLELAVAVTRTTLTDLQGSVQQLSTASLFSQIIALISKLFGKFYRNYNLKD